MRPGILDPVDILPNGKRRLPLATASKPEPGINTGPEIWPSADFVARVVIASCRLMKEQPYHFIANAGQPRHSHARPVAALVLARRCPDLTFEQIAGMLGNRRMASANALAAAITNRLRDPVNGDWLRTCADKIDAAL